MDKEYSGSCFIGVVGPDSIPILAATSIIQIDRTEADGVPQFIAATKGYVARQEIINKFMESEHDFCLLLDHDMTFPKDTLTRLRSHKLPFVSGYYMRRQLQPIYSVWFEPFDGEWPHVPMLEEPERGRLHELGASGWGCMLLHKDVITETRKILKGEWDILEDDMDVWPYDLAAVMRGDEQIKPLRGDKSDVVGSDIRFPFYARHAGFPLYGDPDVRPAHITQYQLSPDDFGARSVSEIAQLKAHADEHIQKRRKQLREKKAAMMADATWRGTA